MTPRGHYERRKKETERRQSGRRANGAVGWLYDRAVQLLLVICTAGLIFVGFLQWKILVRSDDTNRIIQRPYVTASTLAINTSEMPFYWTFRVNAENSGNTPTKLLRYIVFGSLAPVDPEARYLHPAQENSIWRGVIAPKTNIALEYSWSGIPFSVVKELAEKHGVYYILGAIHYRDQFDNTAEHFSKFCFAVRPTKTPDASIQPAYERCLFWNCMDEPDCKADQISYEAYMDEWRRRAPSPRRSPP